MKILILQSKGKHPGNVDFRESLCLERAFNRIDGIECFAWGKGYSSYQVPFSMAEDWADCFFVLENYSKKSWLPDLSKVNKLKLFWSIDSHLVKTRQRHISIVKNNKINITLNSTSVYVKHYKSISKSIWLPNAYPVDLIDCLDIHKEHDVGFCGNYANRKNFINKLNKQIQMKKDIFTIGQSMVKAINSYKIHFNKNYSNDVNYRTFETLGCKTFLLTDETEDLQKLFLIGKHLDTYNSFEDCKEKIKYYLNHPALLKSIAEEGYLHVQKNHTYDNRAKEIIKIIEESI